MSSKSSVDIELHKISLLVTAGYFIGLHIRYASPLMQFSTYPQAWLDHYTENAYALRDPTIAWGFSTEGYSRWSDMPIPDPFGIFNEAAEFGMTYGVTVAMGPISSRTISSFARSDREFKDDEIEEIQNSIRVLHQMTEPPESLTDAQIEALRCIAAGDRYAAAAQKLRISESAFKARLIAARQKLLARTTAEAIQRAKDYRLI